MCTKLNMKTAKLCRAMVAHYTRTNDHANRAHWVRQLDAATARENRAFNLSQ